MQEKHNYLVVRFGCGAHPVGAIVELTESQAGFYKAKIQKLPESQKLEVATPKPKRTRKPKVENPAE